MIVVPEGSTPLGQVQTQPAGVVNCEMVDVRPVPVAARVVG